MVTILNNSSFVCFKRIVLSAIKFDLSPVEEKPSRRYRKGSKYDPIINKFLDEKNSLAIVEIKGRDANYIRTRLR